MNRKEEIEQAALRHSDVYENMQSFYKGGEWADQTMIKKACKWLDENCRRYILTAKDISDFKKAMEE